MQFTYFTKNIIANTSAVDMLKRNTADGLLAGKKWRVLHIAVAPEARTADILPTWLKVLAVDKSRSSGRCGLYTSLIWCKNPRRLTRCKRDKLPHYSPWPMCAGIQSLYKGDTMQKILYGPTTVSWLLNQFEPVKI